FGGCGWCGCGGGVGLGVCVGVRVRFFFRRVGSFVWVVGCVGCVGVLCFWLGVCGGGFGGGFWCCGGVVCWFGCLCGCVQF
ncbi:hypothetical protein, partial [Pseudomonas syringae group genomosp. 7]|uniref:hypothetical protein n=1 Tax=Pseudomonas syringae group genomosp. 7 TaxID=251699 RepID=UPI00376F9CE4